MKALETQAFLRSELTPRHDEGNAVNTGMCERWSTARLRGRRRVEAFDPEVVGGLVWAVQANEVVQNLSEVCRDWTALARFAASSRRTKLAEILLLVTAERTRDLSDRNEPETIRGRERANANSSKDKSVQD